MRTLSLSILAAALSVIGIGGGWLWNRPWAMGLMLLVFVALLVWFVRFRKAVAPVSPAASVMPPPPPPPV